MHLFMHDSRGARTPVWQFTIPLGTLPILLLGGIIENQNSDFVTHYSSKAILALLRDEVRILIFDDPAEQED
jgi:hypothetical protein